MVAGVRRWDSREGPTACSRRSASVWASAGVRPRVEAERALQQLVTAGDLSGDAGAGGGQADAVVGRVMDQAEGVEPLGHGRHGGVADGEGVGEIAGGDSRRHAPEGREGLEELLDGGVEAALGIGGQRRGRSDHADTSRAVRYMTAMPAVTPDRVVQVRAGSWWRAWVRAMRRPTSTMTWRMAPTPMARKIVVQKGE